MTNDAKTGLIDHNGEITNRCKSDDFAPKFVRSPLGIDRLSSHISSIISIKTTYYLYIIRPTLLQLLALSSQIVSMKTTLHP